MKTFNWASFTRKIAVKAKLATIYDAWANPAEIEKWFLSKANYYDANRHRLNRSENFEKGHTYEWSWFNHDITENGSIKLANGKDRIQFSFAGSCLVDIKLTAQKEYVIVELSQKNIPTDEESREKIRLGCDSGWSFYLVNLKSVYEGGHDLRNKLPAFKGMVNS
jgi:uncharacterized protein YndB with AHSA1/START domain